MNGATNTPVQALEEYTDLGNAKRIVRLAQDKAVYVSEIAQWLSWNGLHWQKDETGMLPFVEEMLTELRSEAAVFGAEVVKWLKDNNECVMPTEKEMKKDPVKYKDLKPLLAQRDAALKWVLASQNGARIRAAVSLAQQYQASQGKSASIHEFDNKGDFIGVANGVVKLSTGELIQGDASYKITKCVNATYDPEATCPNWEYWINEYMGGDVELVKYIQKQCGVALAGGEKDRMFIHVGAPDAGKSTVQKTLFILAHDYASVAEDRLLTHDTFDKAYHMAQLYGVRLLNIAETKEDAKLDDKLVKACLDSGEITGRHPAGRPFQFQPEFTGIISTNHMPYIGDDKGVWKRVRIVQWNYKIPDSAKDAKFIEKNFKPELNGILNWCIKGYQAYLSEGWNDPERITQEMLVERHDQDDVQMFLDTFCFITGNDRDWVDAVALRLLFVQYRKELGAAEMGSKTFNKKLRERGLVVKILKKNHDNQMAVLGVKMPCNVERDTPLNVVRVHLDKYAKSQVPENDGEDRVIRGRFDDKLARLMTGANP